MLSQPGAHLVTGVASVFSRHVPSSQNMGSSLARIQGQKTVLDLSYISMVQIFAAQLRHFPPHLKWRFQIDCWLLLAWWCDNVTLPPGDCDQWDNAGHIRLPSPRSHYMPSPIVTCALASLDTQDTHNPFRSHARLSDKHKQINKTKSLI